MNVEILHFYIFWQGTAKTHAPILLQKRFEQSTADTLARLGVFPVGTGHPVNSLSCFPLVNAYAWPFPGAIMQHHHYCCLHVPKADLVPRAADYRPFS